MLVRYPLLGGITSVTCVHMKRGLSYAYKLLFLIIFYAQAERDLHPWFRRTIEVYTTGYRSTLIIPKADDLAFQTSGLMARFGLILKRIRLSAFPNRQIKCVPRPVVSNTCWELEHQYLNLYIHVTIQSGTTGSSILRVAT